MTPGFFNPQRAWTLQDIDPLSHEIAEWADDPFINNFVQPWTSPAIAPQCSNVLETGDPVVGVGFTTETNTFRQGPTPNGTQVAHGFYHPEDEALLPWFMRLNPSPAQIAQSGTNGRYSFMGDLNPFPGTGGPRSAGPSSAPTPPAVSGAQVSNESGGAPPGWRTSSGTRHPPAGHRRACRADGCPISVFRARCRAGDPPPAAERRRHAMSQEVRAASRNEAGSAVFATCRTTSRRRAAGADAVRRVRRPRACRSTRPGRRPRPPRRPGGFPCRGR